MEDKRLEKIVTIDADLHRELKILAAKKGETLRKLAETAIDLFLAEEAETLYDPPSVSRKEEKDGEA